MGRERQPSAELPQKHLEITPTRTIYEFSGAGVTLTVKKSGTTLKVGKLPVTTCQLS